MATLATNQISPAGLVDADAVSVAANAGGDKVRPGPTTFLRVKNGGGAGITVTIDDPNSKSPLGASAFNADPVISVAAGKVAFIGPLGGDRFAAASDGLVAVTYSGVTTVTVGAFAV